MIAIPGYPGQRFWVPVGGGLICVITIFDEGVQVSAASSITQLNFVGAAVTANVSVQSPSGHPGIAATVTVIPVTVGNEPPTSPKMVNCGGKVIRGIYLFDMMILTFAMGNGKCWWKRPRGSKREKKVT